MNDEPRLGAEVSYRYQWSYQEQGSAYPHEETGYKSGVVVAVERSRFLVESLDGTREWIGPSHLARCEKCGGGANVSWRYRADTNDWGERCAADEISGNPFDCTTWRVPA